MDSIEQLQTLRRATGTACTQGLTDGEIAEFSRSCPQLRAAISAAERRFLSLPAEWREILSLPEEEACRRAQEGVLNFYGPTLLSPYLPLAAEGPWIVSAYGAVIYETGGYGMLGFGHNPHQVINVLSSPEVMANVLTPGILQRDAVKVLTARIGESRPAGCPYAKFVFLNSGSEAMAFALRIVDFYAKGMTDPGGRHAGKKICRLALSGSFHGRTYQPAQVSDSSMSNYLRLASMRGFDALWTVDINDVDQIKAAFDRADRESVFLETVLFEPVMGEGRPGESVTPEFYAALRALTAAHGSILIADSIQAGLRGHGVLSVVDYPGFEMLDPPDMESFSKALNAGQYPLSVLSFTATAAALYSPGLYGNTMSATPRGLEVLLAVLDRVTPELRDNIVRQGDRLKEDFERLHEELPAAVKGVTGTGLLVGVDIDESIPVTGTDSLEQRLRRRGLNVIHGGHNALRFTPHFLLNDAERELIVKLVREELRKVVAP